MKAVALKAYPRSLSRRGGAKRVRALGRVPAVIYGRSAQPRNLEVAAKEFHDLIQRSASETIFVDLTVEGDGGGEQMALVQEIQHHPLSGQLLHVDLHQVAAGERVTVTIPLESVGVAAGVKAGGVLEHVLFKVKLNGLPQDLPELIEVDVSHLNIGETIHLSEIKLPEGVKVVGDPGIPVLSVAAPITEAQEEAALEVATGSPTEPTMIKEKKEGESAAAAPASGEKAEKAEKGDKKK